MTTSFFTDKYELTMIQAAIESGQAFKPSVFELFARKLPNGRQYGIVGGVNRAIEAVKDFRFSDEQIKILEKDPIFNSELIKFVKNYKFNGKISGYHEGSVYFPYSPILTVESTFAEGVILETLLLSILNHDSAIASAASRMVNAARGKLTLIEMGSRRTHEEAAVAAARIAYGVGFDFTSNLEAHDRYGVPAAGTAAHAFTLVHATEREAFEAQVKALGVSTTLLVDTYNIEEGIRTAIDVAGVKLGGIRIDSGDLEEETFKARRLLDSLGAINTKIILSSDIDEYSIDKLVKANAPVDSVGVGTQLVTGSGHPTASMVYKLVEIDGKPVAKKANGKISLGGRKNAWRTYDSDGFISEEFFSTDEIPNNFTTIQKVYAENGAYHTETLDQVRVNHRNSMNQLPDSAKNVSPEETFITAQQF